MASKRRFFLVERYVPSMAAPTVASSVRRLNAADGTAAHHMMTLLVPREETCLSIFEAADADAVEAANAHARFEVDRVIEVQVFPGSGTQRRGDFP